MRPTFQLKFREQIIFHFFTQRITVYQPFSQKYFIINFKKIFISEEFEEVQYFRDINFCFCIIFVSETQTERVIYVNVEDLVYVGIQIYVENEGILKRERRKIRKNYLGMFKMDIKGQNYSFYLLRNIHKDIYGYS